MGKKIKEENGKYFFMFKNNSQGDQPVTDLFSSEQPRDNQPVPNGTSDGHLASEWNRLELDQEIQSQLRAAGVKIYLIDELDRSLHTLLSQKLIGFFHASCSNNSRSQLILSTHDLLLMDQDIFRRDEMWVTERNTDGSSKLFSFSEYKELRNDKNLRKSYLQGRLGGIPKILLKDRDVGCLEVN